MIKQDIKRFLELNGFTPETISLDGNNIWSNGKCRVQIMKSTLAVSKVHSIQVTEEDYIKEVMLIPNLNIYWLIGYFTYYGYIDKEYKQL